MYDILSCVLVVISLAGIHVSVTIEPQISLPYMPITNYPQVYFTSHSRNVSSFGIVGPTYMCYLSAPNGISIRLSSLSPPISPDYFYLKIKPRKARHTIKYTQLLQAFVMIQIYVFRINIYTDNSEYIGILTFQIRD